MIYDLLDDAVKKWNNKTAVICNGNVKTYSELSNMVDYIAKELKKYKGCAGNNILLAMDNSMEFVESFFAINKAGGTIIPVYMNMGESKLKSIIEHYEITCILTLKKYKKKIDAALEGSVNYLEKVLYIEDNGSTVTIDSIDYKPGFRPAPYYKGKNPGMILFSSGTTNLPKGIMLSDSNILSNVTAISEYLSLTCEDKVLLMKNINHSSSITGEMLVSIHNGCLLHIQVGFITAASIMDTISRHKISVLFGVPTILTAMITHSEFNKFDMNSLRIINFYGASMAISKIRELADKFPKVNLIYSYGLTEASPRVTYIKREDLLSKEGSSGIPLKGIEVKIMVDKQEARAYEQGEIYVKGPNVMMGYYKNEEKTKQTLVDGYLLTGDLGWLDSDGYLYVKGRKDNMIIKSGKNIYPEEIEAVLMGYPGMKEVLVRGEADDLVGEEIVAYVVSDGEELKLFQVLKHCNKALEDYKVPGRIYQVKELEKTVSNKIMRKQVFEGI
ncbi:class I adenylate-forming enzyme family protein [Anaerocolumna sp. AGMB13025]|uniref:class I adenylate-forming enzyme family protein n=1 Tax=Anaerocolumna sp. AGMB13025 TaxID=3039116 RepID=UPI00241F5FFE|nr:class I adenylate-forming enzyme family protein [Anaerocolumna sp. AGMB13025]WFR55652.1 class I adenylate-forming enzyme family protein [Anaerocolumna sp. AGMB13025]